MRFLQRILIPVFVVLFSISLSARGEAALDEVLTATAESISRIQTVRAKGIWQIEFDMQGMKQKTELETALIYERPRRQRTRQRTRPTADQTQPLKHNSGPDPTLKT